MDRKNMNIAILINNLNAGGCERTAAFLINNLHNLCNIHLIMFSDEIHYQIPEDLNKWIMDNVEQKGWKRLKYPGLLPKTAKQISEYLLKHNIETLITFNHLPAGLGCRVKQNGWKGKLLLNEQIHCSEYIKNLPDGIRRRFKVNEIKKYYPWADVIIANALEIKSDLEENFSIQGSKIKVIGNPVDFPFIKEQSLKKTGDLNPDKDFIFIHVGRYEPQKNHQLLIDGFRKASIPKSKLWLIGDGNGFKEVKSSLEKKGMDKVIIQWGIQKNPFSFLKQADAFVLSSDYEGFPNVMLEAMACGLPVISTNCKSGPSELVSNKLSADIFSEEEKVKICESGILIRVGNSEALAEAMSLIYKDATLRDRIRISGEQRVLDYDSQKIFKLYSALIFNAR
jgi:N-acetylgalactosamine-N,N'-diacetylbacillosaminyl-diphospho-undecaprenol 4-alpha-N-acetylgalactosaminyltransferase